jgi:RNA:NAD 2'-phosphotransferase (TPT1/KptA family)
MWKYNEDSITTNLREAYLIVNSNTYSEVIDKRLISLNGEKCIYLIVDKEEAVSLCKDYMCEFLLTIATDEMISDDYKIYVEEGIALVFDNIPLSYVRDSEVIA